MLLSTFSFWLNNLESESPSVVFDSLWPHGLYSPWNSPGQNTGVGSLSLKKISQPRDPTQVSHTTGRFFTSWATREYQTILRWQNISKWRHRDFTRKVEGTWVSQPRWKSSHSFKKTFPWKCFHMTSLTEHHLCSYNRLHTLIDVWYIAINKVPYLHKALTFLP